MSLSQIFTFRIFSDILSVTFFILLLLTPNLRNKTFICQFTIRNQNSILNYQDFARPPKLPHPGAGTSIYPKALLDGLIFVKQAL